MFREVQKPIKNKEGMYTKLSEFSREILDRIQGDTYVLRDLL